MARAGKSTSDDLLVDFTDILYFSDHQQVPDWLRKFFKQKGLSYLLLPVNKFSEIVHRLDLIGTVLIDLKDKESADPHKLAKVIELLEQNSIGVILLNTHPEVKKKTDIGLVSDNGADDINLDELWLRISVNLAYRKKSPGMVVKPAKPPRETIRTSSLLLLR